MLLDLGVRGERPRVANLRNLGGGLGGNLIGDLQEGKDSRKQA